MPRRVRLAVYGFLAAVILSGILGIEAWPLSGFRLFSQVRSGVEVRWELLTVAADGTEVPADLAAMGRGFRQSGHLLPALAAGGEAHRADACQAWLGHTTASELHVYRSVYRSPEPGRPGALERRTLQFTCART